jgi:hypothetical protein
MSEIRDNSGSAPRSFTIDATSTPELIELRPLPRRTPTWLKTGVAAAGLGVAVIGWSLYGGASSGHIETAALPPLQADDERDELKLAQQQAVKYQELLEEERHHNKELEQHAAVSHGGRDPLVQDLLARERARARAIEQLAAGGASDRELLAQERTRRKEAEQQLALRRDDAYLLAQEQAHSKELEQQLARERARGEELEQQLAGRERDRELLAQERTRSKELEQQLVLRQNDRDVVAREWARSKELAQQLAALRGNDQDLLALERTRNKELEQQLAGRARDQQLLVEERARSKALEQQLAARPDAVPATDPAQASAPPAAPPPPVIQPGDWPAMAPAQRPANVDAARLIARAKLLIAQGDIGGARMVLERAAESGSAPAVFALAETYDAAVLSAWGTFGTHGDSARAQQLYAEALAGGIQEAKARLKAPPE